VQRASQPSLMGGRERGRDETHTAEESAQTQLALLERAVEARDVTRTDRGGGDGAKMFAGMAKRCMNSSEGRCPRRMRRGMRYARMRLRADTVVQSLPRQKRRPAGGMPVLAARVAAGERGRPPPLRRGRAVAWRGPGLRDGGERVVCVPAAWGRHGLGRPGRAGVRRCRRARARPVRYPVGAPVPPYNATADSCFLCRWQPSATGSINTRWRTPQAVSGTS
jgi:hypothetical protein